MMKRLCALLLFALPSLALATDYYVRTDGNDSNTGTANTSGGAWLTVTKCTNTLVAGDTCWIQPGEYYSTTRIVETTSGSYTDNTTSGVAGCTCTKGSTAVTCTTNASTFTAGDFIQCDSGNGFFFTEVASVDGNNITLTEAYPGPTSTSPGNDTADELRPIRYIGATGTTPNTDPTDTRITMFTGANMPTFSQNGTYAHVYQYDTGSASGVWTAPTAMRERGTSAQTWDQAYAAWDLVDASSYPSGKNGLDSYYKYPSSSNCPCNRGTVLQNVADVAGSFGIDGTTVYVHTYDAVDPDTLNMEASSMTIGASNQNLFAITADNIIVEGLTFETAGEHDTESGNTMYGVYQNNLANLRVKWDNVRVHGQFVLFGTFASSIVDILFQDLKVTSGMNDVSAMDIESASGLRWNRVEVRGGHNNGWATDDFYGASSSDPIIVDGLYLHRTRTDIINQTGCGASPDWFNCDGPPVTRNIDAYEGSHGFYVGSAGSPNENLSNVLIQNCIIEANYDGLGLYSGNADTNVIVRNCTFGLKGEYFLTGDTTDATGGTTGLSLYNNVWLREQAASSGGRAVQMYFDTATETPTSDYNAMVFNDANGVNVLSTQAWWRKQVTPNAEYDLAEVRSTFSQEANSLIICDSGDSGCSASVPNKVYAVASPFGTFTDTTFAGGTDYTPVAGSPLIDAGSNAQCPETDFYGNPRDDGNCDIGAVEYQGTQCSDGIDNDSDGQTDYPNDTACVDANDTDESCGDNNTDADDVCDGTDLNSETCVTQGFASGTLACLSNCSAYDTSSCVAGGGGSTGTIIRGATVKGGTVK